MVSSPNNLLYLVKFVVKKKRLINDDDDDDDLSAEYRKRIFQEP